jgi:DNA-binding PadR family transcriptional regulator
LERSGAIEEVADGAGTAAANGPFVPTGSVKGDLAAARMRLRARPTRRTRRAYAITEHGRKMFTELLTEEGDDDERAFAVKLLFCGHLEPAARLAFLERRRAQLNQRLVAARKPATRTIDRYSRSLLEHRARSTQNDLDWIAELIAQERAEQQGDRTEGATA